MGLIVSYFDNRICSNLFEKAKNGKYYDYFYDINKITNFYKRRYCIDECIMLYAKHGHIKLLKSFDVFNLYNNKHVLVSACSNHIDCVKYLLDYIPTNKLYISG